MSRLLLDTHAFLWWIDDSADLSGKARAAIEDAGNECFLSIASCWEMAIKVSLGKLKLAKPVDRLVTEQLVKNAFNLLNINLRHVTKIERLPFHHHDPFDRLIIAQALAEKLAIISEDHHFLSYNAPIIW